MTIEAILKILATILLALVAIFLIRIILRILLHFAHKKYKNLLKNFNDKKVIKAEKITPKTDENLSRKKEGMEPSFKNFKGQLIEKMPLKNQEENQKLEEVKIVDIVKPVGFWTSMILGQKLTYLVSSAKIMNKNSDKGFWISMVEAQEKAAGRQKGRSL